MKWFASIVLLLLLLADLSIWQRWQKQKVERRHENEIIDAARRYGVRVALVKAVVWKESRFQEAIRGSAGEIGLMQIREPAAREWATAEGIPAFEHEMLVHPGSNTLAGTWYLRKMLERYNHLDDPLPYALADYNAGRRNVLRWMHGTASTNSAAFLELMDFPGTRNYIHQVRERYALYQQDFATVTASR